MKRASGGVPSMPETLCAFANMPDGGTIILGVDEGNGRFEVTGLTDLAAIESGIISQARQAVTPSPQLVPQQFIVNGKQLLVLHVVPLPATDRPATADGVAYLRQPDGDCPMHEHELRMLEVAKLHLDEQVEYDLRAASGLDIDDLVPELVDQYIATARSRDGRLRNDSREQTLRNTSVLTRTGEPTLAGLYALGDYPQGRYPALTVTAAVQLPGGEGQHRNTVYRRAPWTTN
ncbi:AlbA family DNA-binding domain-containing protein [Propioniferax innocua]|uniref:AlbA family DNA-binding domain-containing protein n=1 Tax=Propioniferax innocua TaxID=1753 RepID=UPI0024821FDA|nr:RNA-binding domain-containing protein [Propioniferax innocua]